jgi:hypothetical protein
MVFVSPQQEIKQEVNVHYMNLLPKVTKVGQQLLSGAGQKLSLSDASTTLCLLHYLPL